jgi:hypothetical protein
MRLRISLFEFLLFVVPAFAVVMGLLVASAKSSEVYLLTIAQSVYPGWHVDSNLCVVSA